MSDPAADAIARAKEIAARLAGSSTSSSGIPTNNVTLSAAPADPAAVAEAALAAAFGSDAASKKRRWGNESSNSAEDAVAAAMSMKRSKASIEKKVWIPSDKNPGYNYIGLLIGPGGSKQRDLIDQAGGNVKISIRGRGSSSGTNGSSAQENDEPLHVLLEGSVECVDKAEQLVNELLHDSAKANAEKDRQLAQVNNARGATGVPSGTGVPTSTATGAAVSSYQPKPVAQLLGLNPVPTGADAIEEKIGVPNGVVGYIIGKGGESITSMQRRSGCRVQIQKEHEMDAGSTQRIITLTAATPESIAQCRAIIEGMVQERLRLNQEQQSQPIHQNRGTGGANAAAQAAQLQQALAEGQALIKVPVPNADVGLIIGKGGTTIRSIQDRSGANVQIPQGPDADNPAIRTVSVTHPQTEGAEFAKTLIEEVLQSKATFQTNHHNQQQQQSYSNNTAQRQPNPGDISMQIQIPDKDVGMCIGRGGCVIREMQGKTQTRIQIPSMPTPGQMYRIATITGPAEGCQKISEIIARISAEQSSQFVITGEAFANTQQQPYAAAYNAYAAQQPYAAAYGQQQQQQAYGSYSYGQQQPATQQTQQQQQQGATKSDYSAEWAAYYAAQAASTGTAATAAAATPAAATATATATSTTTATATTDSTAATTATSTTQQQPAADAYHDAFFRYAYHYGDEAARQYYGAWSPPQGTPNPYGTNPNLTAAPAAASATAAVPATAAPAAEIKDSSVRNVSNLPAWMTKS